MKSFKLLLLLTAIFACSCILKPTEDVYLPEETKQYLMYNKGSYVVLHNDSLNLTDTITTIKVDYYWGKYHNRETYDNQNYEQLKVEYYSSYYKCSVFDELYYILDDSEYGFYTRRNDINVAFSFDMIYYHIGNFGGCIDCSKNKTIEIDSTSYNTTLYIYNKSSKDSTWASYYFAPNIGLIRKIYHYPSHEMKWDMVSYYNSGQPAKE